MLIDCGEPELISPARGLPLVVVAPRPVAIPKEWRIFEYPSIQVNHSRTRVGRQAVASDGFNSFAAPSSIPRNLCHTYPRSI
jgi:hypothetical protein